MAVIHFPFVRFHLDIVSWDWTESRAKLRARPSMHWSVQSAGVCFSKILAPHIFVTPWSPLWTTPMAGDWWHWGTVCCIPQILVTSLTSFSPSLFVFQITFINNLSFQNFKICWMRTCFQNAIIILQLQNIFMLHCNRPLVMGDMIKATRTTLTPFFPSSGLFHTWD